MQLTNICRVVRYDALRGWRYRAIGAVLRRRGLDWALLRQPAVAGATEAGRDD